MASIYDVPQNELIEKTAEELKKIKDIKPPAWASFVKTGVFKERPPVSKDWWYMRAAALLRRLYKNSPIGVSKLRTYFGGRKNRGMKPEKFFKGSGSVIRKIMQQLETAGLAKKEEKGIHKGRAITPKGTSILDKVATQIQKSIPRQKAYKAPSVQEEKKPEPKKEVQNPKQEKNG